MESLISCSKIDDERVAIIGVENLGRVQVVTGLC